MDNPPELYDREAHGAWLASLLPDESLVVHTAAGHRMNCIWVALAKRALLTEGIKPGEQLALLEKMNTLVDQNFTAEMLAAIEPMGDTEYKIFAEAHSLDRPSDKSARASFDVLTSPRVFWHLATLNPSILAALRGHRSVPCKSANGEQHRHV